MDNVQADEADELKPKKVPKPEVDTAVSIREEKLKPKKHLKPIL